jgi:hypothetical protein
MRILFYLPVVTPWWFDTIVEPLIRCLARDHEVHVLAPVPWKGTGVGRRELSALHFLPQVRWHIVDGDSHPTMRTEPRDRADIIDFVRSLAPDYVLCRSADCETVRGFPGVVRHMMEGGAAPLAVPNDWLVLQDEPFDHGMMPALDVDQYARLDRLVAPIWRRWVGIARPTRQERKSFYKTAGIPSDRPVLLLPLEYEHEENFFPIHRVGAAPNHRLIAELAERIDDRFFLAITNHPLNELHVDNTALKVETASHGKRMLLLPGTARDGANMTMALARYADGMLVGDSKVYSTAGFFGTPLLRRSHFKTGDWLHAYSELDSFLTDVAARTAARPNCETARLWFAFHIANNLLNPNDPDLTAADILARLDHPIDPARWDRGFAHYAAAAS